MSKRTDLLIALMECSTTTEAIKAAGVSRKTAYGWMRSETFQLELMALKRETVGSVAGYLQSRLGKVAEVLVGIAEDESLAPQIRINASDAVFRNCRALTETSDLLGRVEQLEKRAQGYESTTERGVA